MKNHSSASHMFIKTQVMTMIIVFAGWAASLSASTTKSQAPKTGTKIVEIVNGALACITVKPIEVDHDDQLILLEAQLTSSQGNEGCGCKDGLYRWNSSRGQNGVIASTGVARDPFLTNGAGNARKYTFVLESDSALNRPDKYFLNIDCKS